MLVGAAVNLALSKQTVLRHRPIVLQFGPHINVACAAESLEAPETNILMIDRLVIGLQNHMSLIWEEFGLRVCIKTN